jgi:tetratricopeptide (TPR) repeat protein
LSVGEIALVAAGGATHEGHLLQHADGCDLCRSAIAIAIRAARSTGEHAIVDDAQLARVRVGRYVVAELIGEGGMGRVYAAYDPELARTIALKLLREAPSPEALARLAREAQVMAQLTHPNIVAIYDIGRHGLQTYVAMELVAGDTVRAWIAAQPRTWREIVEVFVQAGRGLAAAHAAGVVHRDIKPDNMFVGRDGRVRIGDFGLARVADAPALAEGTPASGITRTNAVVGTIPYMAPEQLEGKGSDERSDQYAFCVSLYEALYGARPFAGSTVAELRAAFDKAPAPDDKLPRWLRAAIVRGLARDPAMRFASMDALIAALTLDPGAKRRRIVLAVLGAAGLGVVIAGAWARGAQDPCSDAASEITAVWPARSVDAAWRASAAPNALATWERVAKGLDRFAASWSDSALATCRAARVDRGALHELRTLCLDRRRQELAGVVDALRDPSPAIAERAVSLVDGMEPVAQCNNLEALRAPVPPPRDADTARQVEALEGRLRALGIALRTAKLATVDRDAKDIVDRAVALGYPPLVAEAWRMRGEVTGVLGDTKTAEAAFYEALWAAQAGRDRRAEVVVWRHLVDMTGVERAKLDEGVRLAHHADAALRGLGEDGRLRAELEVATAKLYRERGEYDRATASLARARATAPADSLLAATIESTGGTIAFRVGRYDEALAAYQKAHDLVVAAYGPQHPQVARSLSDIGNIYKDRDDFPRALDYYNQALALLDKSVAADHPLRGAVEGNLALVFLEQRKYDEALAHQRSAIAILEKANGPDHPSVGLELNNIALTLIYSKHAQDALPYLERARALFVKTAGPEHLDVAMTEHNLGLAYRQLKDDARAESHFRASIAIREKVAPEHPELARTEAVLAAMLTGTNRFDDAVDLLRRAIVIYDKVHGPTSPLLAKPLLDLGWTLNQQKKYAEAIAPLERAVVVHEAAKSDLLPVVRLELATALWEADRDRPRAVELAKLVKQSIDPKSVEDVKEIDAWLAKHRVSAKR